MELIPICGRTYYIRNATNIGVYKQENNHVYIIDSGNDSEAGKKILKRLEQEGFCVKGIIVTHSNADHIGGNQWIQKRTQCPIFASQIEQCLTENPILESAFLYGGFPFQELQTKFLCAKPSVVQAIEEHPIEGLEVIPLKGHFFNMIGIKTSDQVYFLADSLFSEKTIQKYHVCFLYDIQEFLNTLDYLDTLEGTFYVPSHCEIMDDIHPLVSLNRNMVKEISMKIYQFCERGMTFEQILQAIFQTYQLTMDSTQYVLVGSTIRSYLSYLCNEHKLCYEFIDHQMIFKQVDNSIVKD